MSFLFGDSTESTLEFNYLAFLRDAIDFAVAVLQCDAALAAGRDRRASRERAATEAAHTVEAFGRTALQLTEPVAKGSPDAPVGRAAASVGHAATEAVRREVAQIKAGLASDVELIEGEAQRLRGRCVAALGTLLSVHDLPDAAERLVVQWTGSGGYEARLAQKTGYGLEAVLALEVPGSSIFAADVRVDRIADGVEIHAPETAGWLKKEIKMVPHRLGRHHLTELVVDGDGVTFALRATPEAGAAGFDVAVARGGQIRVERAGAGADGSSFDTDDRDLPNLQLLAGRLEDAAAALREQRRTVVEASLDGTALADHGHPRIVADRLIDSMAPVVKVIASHSLAPSELVLKRLLADDRREEIFVSKAELAQKLEPLPMSLRRAFVPLGIVETGAAGHPQPALAVSGSVTVSRPPAHAQPTITMEADPPPLPLARERPARRTGAPPPPPPRAAPEAAASAVDNALRELDESADKKS